MTKHQKSKSHHKKCIGLGIHPNSSRSLEMTGPISDSNDEDGDSDDEDDEDDKDETDSNDDDESYNIEAETDRFEKEIAMSLLDLSQMHRFPDELQRAPVREPVSTATTTTTATVASSNSPLPMPILPAPDNNDSSLDLDEVDAPIDLSVKPISSRPHSLSPVPLPLLLQEPQMKRIKLDTRNGLVSVKSMEIVGEAQRWEPEEDFLRNGCLNLTKVRNVDIDVGEEKPEPVQPNLALVKIERDECSTPEPADQEKAQDFEYEIKKRRRSSSPGPGSNNGPGEPSANSTTSASSDSKATPASSNPPARPQRLHQPWLSPEGQTPSSLLEPEEGGAGVGSRDRTESFNSSITGDTNSNCGSGIGLKDEAENGIESLPLHEPGSLDPAADPNSKLFPGLIGMKPQAEFRQPNGAQAFK